MGRMALCPKFAAEKWDSGRGAMQAGGGSAARAMALPFQPVVTGNVRSCLRPHLQHPAVDRPRRTGHITGFRRGQKRDDRGDLPCVTGPPSGTPGRCRLCGSASVWPVIGVAISPGATALAVIPYCPSSSAMVFISPPKPCLAASYALEPTRG